MLPSSNALFVFDAAARNGSFTAAAAELNVTQPAVSRMLGQFEEHLGVRLFDRTAGRAVLTEEGELLYRRVLEGFRSIETGLVEIERRRKGTETVTLSVSSAFTTHWLMPRIDKLQKQFPTQANILYYRGRAYIAAKKMPEAKADLEKFVSMAPPDARELPDAKSLLEKLKDVK